ncbi:hypothetical protein TVAG_444460 [Trichomonas vaginalis G3]|uniref:Small GTP-binding protein n=1 Tax=Trichomonas vaginalis (strain ATCC PRA-98 / G3) TaxID=412133 RepID=A2E2I7_TRIV3|nr:Rab subfamily of small GTPases [Trichomonas vaginalis G3]EAY13162.1 hypothetical protein TVAG_444460 [Trichomonas vaginalis G3]KAI5528275.1 Rab subfamily of small GTPases [Trichomonas vaginalis G3]|eukprot:XP_001325385.1 hypothetical protein [Trichomonas vaginalis G3]
MAQTVYIAVVGDHEVGKTQLLNMYINERCDESYNPSVGISMAEVTVEPNTKTFNMKIIEIDTLESILNNNELMNKITGYIIIFDYTNPATIDSLGKYISFCGDKHIVFFGNKIDRCPDYEKIERYLLKTYDRMNVFSGSILRNLNVNEVFESLLSSLDDSHKFSAVNTSREAAVEYQKEVPKQSKCCLLI